MRLELSRIYLVIVAVKVMQGDAEAMAKQFNAIHRLTSAKTGEGVNELFEEIGRALPAPANLIDTKAAAAISAEDLKRGSTRAKKEAGKKCC